MSAMDWFAVVSVSAAALLILAWLFVQVWALADNFGFEIFYGCAIALVFVCGAVGAVWLLGTRVL